MRSKAGGRNENPRDSRKFLLALALVLALFGYDWPTENVMCRYMSAQGDPRQPPCATRVESNPPRPENSEAQPGLYWIWLSPGFRFPCP